MKATVIVSLALASLCVSCPCNADRTVTNRSLNAFWGQFQEGVSSINVYSSLRKMVLIYVAPEPDGRASTILQWDSESFSLVLRDVEITDLVTGTDAWGRPTFHGSYVSQSPQIEGFVDLTPDGQLLVEIGEVGMPTRRYDTASNGTVTSEEFRECKCTGWAAGMCTSQQCTDQASPCTGGPSESQCKWV